MPTAREYLEQQSVITQLEELEAHSKASQEEGIRLRGEVALDTLRIQAEEYLLSLHRITGFDVFRRQELDAWKQLVRCRETAMRDFIKAQELVHLRQEGEQQ